MAGDGTIRKDDVIDPEVSPALTALTNQFKELNEGAAVFAATLKLFPGDFANSIKSMSDLSKATAQQDLLTAEITEKTKKLSEEKKKLTEEFIREKEATKAAIAEAKIKAQLDKEDEITLRGRAAANKLLTKERDNLNLLTTEGIERQNELNAKINENNAIIKQNTDLQKQQTLNIGNYTENINNATLNLGEMRKELMILKNTSFAGKTNEEIDSINQRMGTLMKEMKESKAAVTNLGKNGFELATGSAKFFAASVETVVGALSVMGVKSETLEKLKGNITQLIAVTHGLSEIEEVLKTKTLQATALRLKDTAVTIYNTVAKWSGIGAIQAEIVAKQADVVATEEDIAATEGLTVAQWLWNAALYACPIVIIILAVAALATGVYFLVKALNSGEDATQGLTDKLNELKKQAAETEAFNKFAEDLMKAYDMAETGMVEAKIKHTKQKIDLIKTEMAAEMALAKAKHEWTADQSKEYTKQAQELGNLNGELILLGIELNKSKQEDIKKQKEAEEDKYKTFLKDQVNYAEAKRAKDTEANQKELDDHLKVIETKRKLALYEAKSPGEIAKINAEADKEIFESKKKYSDEQRKLAEDDQKFWDEQIAETEKTEKQAADLKIKQDKDEEKELDAEAERLFKIQENETKRELELKKKQKEDEKRLAKQTIDVINGYFDLQTNTLKAEEEKQLSNTHLSEDQKLKIKHDFAKKEAEVERKKAEMAKVTGTMKAIIDTAEGVSGVLADFPGPVGWVMAIIQGALGAAQIAEIIAQPLPQIPSFKKGVKGFEGGQAQVHGKEIVQLQTGEKFLTLGGVDEPINTFLPKGTNVIPNEIVREQILQMPKARNNDDVLMQNQLLAELVKETKKDKPAVNFDIDANGINAFYSTRNSRIKYINSRFRGRS